MNQISLTQSVVAEIQTIKAKKKNIFQSITPPNHSSSINIPKKKKQFNSLRKQIKSKN